MSKIKTEKYIDTIGDWVDKLPALPKSWKEFIVNITPILALIFGILGIIAALASLRDVLMGFAVISTLLYLTASILLVVAYKETKAKKYKGWNLLFLSFVANLIGGLIMTQSIVWFLIWVLVGLYLLFQIRPYYK